MKNKMTVSKMKKKVWTEFSKYIRTRDCLRTTGCSSWGLCVSCGKRYHFKLLQAGHFLPGRHNATLFYERGCHAQCFYCNMRLYGNTLSYMDALIKLYGEGIIEELRENDKIIKKFIIPELEDLRIGFKSKLKEVLNAQKPACEDPRMSKKSSKPR